MVFRTPEMLCIRVSARLLAAAVAVDAEVGGVEVTVVADGHISTFPSSDVPQLVFASSLSVSARQPVDEHFA